MKVKKDKITFRLFSPYDELVPGQADLAKMSVGHYGRVATMFMADTGLLQLKEQMNRIEHNQIQILKVIDTMEIVE